MNQFIQKKGLLMNLHRIHQALLAFCCFSLSAEPLPTLSLLDSCKSFATHVHTTLDTTIGTVVEALAGDSYITDPDIQILVTQAEIAFKVPLYSTRLCWITNNAFFNQFSDFVWGDTIFLNEHILQDDPTTLEWAVWHSMAHIKRHDYSSSQILFALGGIACKKLILPSGGLVKSMFSTCILSYAYLKFIRSIELQATMHAAHVACISGKRSLAETICERYKQLTETMKPGSRPCFLFPTYQKLYHAIRSVIEKYDILDRLINNPS